MLDPLTKLVSTRLIFKVGPPPGGGWGDPPTTLDPAEGRERIFGVFFMGKKFF